MMRTTLLLSLSTLIPLMQMDSADAARRVNMKHVDLTMGEVIPKEATHDWNLGATGARGWIYSVRLETSKARQIGVTKVAKGSPADGVLKMGDVILGVAGKPFAYDPRVEFGKALTSAEAKSGKLSVIRWRGGEKSAVDITLPVLGTYSATAPYDCPKSKRILEEGCKALAQRMEQPNYKVGNIPRCWNALALLASGNESYLPLVKREAEWASQFSARSMATWYYGYVITLLAEYQMATGDDAYEAGMKRLALEAARGQSIVGSWGHKFAGDDGRLVGYGMMNAPGLTLTTALVLARMAGVQDPDLDLAIDRSAKMLRFYQGKGAVPYGDHAPWIQTHEDNGKCGMAAMLFNLLEEKETSPYFARMSLASHGSERDTGHTGNYWNISWALPAVSLSGPEATGAWMKEFGAWYFDFGRQVDWNFRHQGPPNARPDKTGKWDATGHYLLAYALPLKQLMITGRKPPVVPQLTANEAQSIVEDGRGWSNIERTSFYDVLDSKELFKRLGSWSPVVRERAAMALVRRKDTKVEDVIERLKMNQLECALGACQTLAGMGGKAAPAVPALQETLKSNNLWLRIKAAEALASIGKPAMPALPQLLEMIDRRPSKSDPRGMEQRYLSSAVFGKMLKNSIEGVDRELLRKAVIAGLQNQDGRSRSTIGRIYNQLSYEELRPLLPAIRDAIAKPAPSGIMFADGIRMQGLNLLAKHRVKEGIPLCLSFVDTDRWNKKRRILGCLDALAKYGSAAKPEMENLKQLEKVLGKHREKKNFTEHFTKIKSIIETIESGQAPPKLRSLEESDHD
ncbi:MAG: acetylesterase [Verrucomicrobiae bacterium]|nr:acetylesterase [Verrucomicrobiae bacterium]NNJ44367.1 acetylesterase [Akkermansiaceae bacterium]